MTKTSEIRNWFNECSKELTSQKKTFTQAIKDWRSKCVEEIDRHAAEETKRLEELCEYQKSRLETARDQMKQKATASSKEKNTEQISELLEQCRQLQFILAPLEYSHRQMKYIKVVITNEQHAQTNQDKKDTDETDERVSRSASAKDRRDNIVDDGNGNDGSTQNPTSASSRQTSRRSPMNQPSPDLNHSASGNASSKSDIKNEDDTNDKCPLCCMIFPVTMISDDRQQHVNGHYDN